VGDLMIGRVFGIAVGFAALLFSSAAAGAACKFETRINLPVTMAGLRPMVSAKINGRDANFIADSGAFFSLISPSVASASGLRLTLAPEGVRLKGVGGEASLATTTVKDFTLAGIPLHNVTFMVGGTDTGMAGLLGQNVLGIGDVEYDLPHAAIRLFIVRDCGHADMAYWVPAGGSYSMLPIEQRSQTNPHTVGTVYLNGAPIRAIFDTGAGQSIVSLRAAAKAGVKPGDPGVVPAGFGRGLGRQRIQSWLAPVGTIKIGDEEIRNARLRIGDLGLPDVDMLIGADFFISHRIYVSNESHRMFFSYTGGEIFNRSARAEGDGVAVGSAEEKSEPTDADGFSRRGAVFATQHDLPHAIADFGRAIELAPSEPRYLVQRARAYLQNREPRLAMADFDKAVAIDPADVPARLGRAELRLAARDRDGARADLDAAAQALPAPADQRLLIGQMYEALDAFDAAIAQFALWIPAHREDARLPEAFNARCWVRALAGRDLDKALDDCNAALRLRPHTPSFLDSRGLVRLRMGAWDKAIEDYDEALKLAPKTGWSLYGRGLARRHKGLTAEGDADLAAAVAINPHLAERAKRLGIS
jgi:tetratricopeptide (TPR) repeat protein